MTKLFVKKPLALPWSAKKCVETNVLYNILTQYLTLSRKEKKNKKQIVISMKRVNSER